MRQAPYLFVQADEDGHEEDLQERFRRVLGHRLGLREHCGLGDNGPVTVQGDAADGEEFKSDAIKDMGVQKSTRAKGSSGQGPKGPNPEMKSELPSRIGRCVPRGDGRVAARDALRAAIEIRLIVPPSRAKEYGQLPAFGKAAPSGMRLRPETPGLGMILISGGPGVSLPLTWERAVL